MNPGRPDSLHLHEGLEMEAKEPSQMRTEPSVFLARLPNQE